MALVMGSLALGEACSDGSPPGDITGVAVDTKVDKDAVLVGDTIQVTCLIDEVEASVQVTTVLVEPEGAATVDDHVLPADPAGVLWEPVQVPEGAAPMARAVGEWLGDKMLPLWLANAGEFTIAALATPSFHLGLVPGVPEGLVIRVAARDVSTVDSYEVVRGALTTGELF